MGDSFFGGSPPQGAQIAQQITAQVAQAGVTGDSFLAQLVQGILNLAQIDSAILTQLKTITPSLMQGSAASGITAFAGGGQASATQLTAQFNEVTTVASAADSVKLLPSAAGLIQFVANAGVSSMQVFGTGTDTIDGVAFGTGVAQGNGVNALYFCPVAGKWYSIGI